MRRLVLSVMVCSTIARAEYPRPGTRAPSSAPPTANRTVAESTPAEVPRGPISMGLRLGGNGCFAKVADSDSSSGFGYSFAVPIYIPLPPQFRISIAPGVQVLSLTRIVDGTGQLIDPNPAEFTQTIKFLSAEVLFGYNVTRGTTGANPARPTNIWLEGGLDFLYPFSANQKDNFGGEETFSSRAKLLFVVLGAAGEYRLDPHFGAGGSLQAGYNLLAGAGTQLLTARFSLDIVFHL